MSPIERGLEEVVGVATRFVGVGFAIGPSSEDQETDRGQDRDQQQRDQRRPRVAERFRDDVDTGIEIVVESGPVAEVAHQIGPNSAGVGPEG